MSDDPVLELFGAEPDVVAAYGPDDEGPTNVTRAEFDEFLEPNGWRLAAET